MLVGKELICCLFVSVELLMKRERMKRDRVCLLLVLVRDQARKNESTQERKKE